MASKLNAFFSRGYSTLVRHAQRRVRGERVVIAPHSLVHRAFERLSKRPDLANNSYTHLRAIALDLMRRISIDIYRYERARRAGDHVSLSQLDRIRTEDTPPELKIALERLKAALSRRKPIRHAQVLQLWFHDGASIKEIALELKVSEAAIKRDLKLLRTMLAELSDPPQPDSHVTST